MYLNSICCKSLHYVIFCRSYGILWYENEAVANIGCAFDTIIHTDGITKVSMHWYRFMDLTINSPTNELFIFLAPCLWEHSTYSISRNTRFLFYVHMYVSMYVSTYVWMLILIPPYSFWTKTPFLFSLVRVLIYLAYFHLSTGMSLDFHYGFEFDADFLGPWYTE